MGQLKNIKVNLPLDMINRVDKIAADRNLDSIRPHSRSSCLREALKAWLDQFPGGWPPNPNPATAEDVQGILTRG